MIVTFLAVLVSRTFLTILVTRALLSVLMTSAFLTILVTRALLSVLMTSTFLSIHVTGTFLTFLMTGTCFLLGMVAAAMTTLGTVVSTAMAALCTVVATALTVTMTGTSTATALAFFHTTASGQFGAGSRISLHIVGIVTQLAHLLTQLVGIGLLGIIVDGQLRRLHVIIVRLNALEIRHILFEFVGAFLTNAIGLNRHGLHPFGGRFALLRTHAQRNQAY